MWCWASNLVLPLNHGVAIRSASCSFSMCGHTQGWHVILYFLICISPSWLDKLIRRPPSPFCGTKDYSKNPVVLKQRNPFSTWAVRVHSPYSGTKSFFSFPFTITKKDVSNDVTHSALPSTQLCVSLVLFIGGDINLKYSVLFPWGFPFSMEKTERCVNGKHPV